MKTLLTLTALTLCLACQSTSSHIAEEQLTESSVGASAAQVPSTTPTTLEQIVHQYVEHAQVNLVYDESMAKLLSSIAVNSLSPDGNMLQIESPVPTVPQFEIIALQHAKAEDLAASIEGFASLTNSVGTESEIKVMADPRTNSLLAMAPPANMAHLKDLIAQLDTQQSAKD
ncbi:MAG: type II secretory pathway component GspD/PulD (secretin) [Planctomycetota bacterium]|jgi:type II secretory pathway component GspD/PulD (secretin)